MTIQQLFEQGLQQVHKGNVSDALACWTTVIQQLEQVRPDALHHPEEFAHWLAQYGNLLASVYSNRGIVRNELGDATGSYADVEAAIAVGEQRRASFLRNPHGYTYWLAQYGNDLARAYNNRGILRGILGESLGSRQDYDAAIAIGEQLRPQVLRNPQGYAAWLDRYGNALAHAYNNRGGLRRDLGDSAGSRTDFDAAIAIGEQARPDSIQSPARYRDWLANDGNVLASAYNNRGLLRRALGDSIGSRNDYNAAIALREALRPDTLQHSPRYVHWLAHYGNDLASAYNNRGILRNALGESGAWEDYDAARQIRERLCTLFIEKYGYHHWLSRYGNDLARVYSNRGSLRQALGDVDGNWADYDAARKDYDAAIEIREELRQKATRNQQEYANWLTQYGNDLAITYSNRGLLRSALGDTGGALRDHNLAIEIREELRCESTQKQGDTHWLAQYGNDLALAYSNRGILRRTLGEYEPVGDLRALGRIITPRFRLAWRCHGASLLNMMICALRFMRMPANYWI